LEDQAARAGEVLDPQIQSMPALRAAAELLQEVSDLPHLFPVSRAEGRDSRGPEGELVSEAGGIDL